MRTKMTALSLAATAALALAIATPVTADSYRFSVVSRNLDRPVGIAVDGSEVVYFTEVPDAGGGRRGERRLSLDLETGASPRVHIGRARAHQHRPRSRGRPLLDLQVGRCDSAGTPRATVALFARGLERALRNRHRPPRRRLLHRRSPTPASRAGGNRVSVIRRRRQDRPVNGRARANGRRQSRATATSTGPASRPASSCAASTARPACLPATSTTPPASPSTTRARRSTSPRCRRPACLARRAGRNRVRAIDLRTGAVRTIHDGRPRAHRCRRRSQRQPLLDLHQRRRDRRGQAPPRQRLTAGATFEGGRLASVSGLPARFSLLARQARRARPKWGRTPQEHHGFDGQQCPNDHLVRRVSTCRAVALTT